MLRVYPLLLILLSLPLGAAVYEAPSDEPTAVEVAILEFMNRFRADPVAETARILDEGDGALPAFFWSQRNFTVDKDMFRRECEALQPAPPLVFDLDLLRGARKHSHYMIINQVLTHNQNAENPGFTGRSFSDRMRAAGFTGRPGGENAFRDAGNAWQSHAGFIIDFGPGGEGGMQRGRGHRMNMINAGFNVVGPSAVPHGQRYSVTHKFGSVSGRFLGGVIYRDQNRNNWFDPGEGISGVEIALPDGSASTRTWESGGYVLPLPENRATQVIVRVGVLQTTVDIPAGSDNVHFSWAVPPAEDRAAADRMIERVESIPDDARNANRRRGPLLELFFGAQGLALDSERQERIDALTKDIVAELALDQQSFFDAIASGERRQWREALRNGQRNWRGTVATTWFDEAEVLARANEGVQGYLEAQGAGREIDPQAVQQLQESLRQAHTASRHPDIQARFAELRTQIQSP